MYFREGVVVGVGDEGFDRSRIEVEDFLGEFWVERGRWMGIMLREWFFRIW